MVEFGRRESSRAFDGKFRIVQPVNLSARQKSCGDAPVREGGSQAIKILRISIRQRLEKDSAQRGEDRCRGADAEGECGDGREGKTRRTAEGAERNADVLQKRFHSWTPDSCAKWSVPKSLIYCHCHSRPSALSTLWQYCHNAPVDPLLLSPFGCFVCLTRYRGVSSGCLLRS